jgi:CRP-like cAMP-binding protein
MHELLYAYFERSFKLTEDDKKVIQRVVAPKTLKKGEFLQRQAEVAKLGAFVCKGFLRSYVIDNKGKEHIIQFAPENWWISDKLGMAEGALATYFIDAIEDSELLTMEMQGHLTMIQKISGYAESFQKGMQKRTAAKDARIVHSLTSTAEERYDDFLATYPTIAQRVPQHMLASYLGITPETLSRIRKAKAKKR